MRTSALYDRFMKALDIVPVTIPAGDTYTAVVVALDDTWGEVGYAFVILFGADFSEDVFFLYHL